MLGSGKNNIIEKLLPELIARHIRVSVIKHSHHNMQVDKEGKDSWRMKEAGSSQVILANDERWAIMTETSKPVSLDYLAQQFDRTLTDLVLVKALNKSQFKDFAPSSRNDKTLPEN